MKITPHKIKTALHTIGKRKCFNKFSDCCAPCEYYHLYDGDYCALPNPLVRLDRKEINALSKELSKILNEKFNKGK